MAYVVADLTTARCRLTPVAAADAPFVYQGLADPRVVAYFPAHVRFHSLEEVIEKQMTFYARHRAEQTGLLWVVRAQDEPLGVVGLYDYRPEHRCAELGYWFTPEHWGKGYGAEVLPAVLAFGFAAWGLNRIEAYVEPENTGSVRLLEKLDFTFEGLMRQKEWRDGRPLDVWVAALLAR